ncbi:MAG TPA: VOC family protein [Solirubrobacterales bacterium]|nr:VOC family protein [Solirubrobacterales bacterium]
MSREGPTPVRGLFETHLTVADVPRATEFYRDVVGFPVALELPERNAAFLWVGDPGRSMLGLWGIGSSVNSMRLHIAFDVALEDALAAPARLRAAGVTPLSFFGAETSEPDVLAWMPAAAVYFHDPDGHLLEYLAMLEEPSRPAAGIVPYSEWVQRYSDS